MAMDLVLADTRLVADLTLELSFVLTTKTLLSEGRDSFHLPLRFNVIFEEYMKLAGLLLDAAVDFSQSSRSMREFAKMMHKNGFISLDPGLNVTAIHHSIIDNIYPDSTIFGGIITDEGDDDNLDGVLDTTELACSDESEEPSVGVFSGCAHSAEVADPQFDRTECRDDAPTASVQRNKEKQMRKIILLKTLCDRQERKHAWIQQKVEKQSKKMLEKELRNTNMKSNVDTGRGQKDRGDKYQTMLSKDADALAFHARNAGKKTRGSKALRMMLAIQQKTGHLQQQLCDADHLRESAMLRILGSPLLPAGPSAGGAPAQAPGVTAHLSAASVASSCFERLDDGESRAHDVRAAFRASSRARQSKVSAGAPVFAHSDTTIGANYKVVRELRGLLKFLGFSGSRDLADLPEFEELRRARKAALPSVHPDKLMDSKDCDASAPEALDFFQLQERYKSLLARYYDTDAKDFSREVKAHRKTQSRQSNAKKAGVAEGTVKADNKIASKGLRYHRPKFVYEPRSKNELDELWRRVQLEKAENAKKGGVAEGMAEGAAETDSEAGVVPG